MIIITFIGGMLQIFDAIMFDEPLRQWTMNICFLSPTL
jgi:hypothetical protein